MIVVNKNLLNTLSITLNGPLVQEAGFVSGYYVVEWVADETGESICMLPISFSTVSWRQTEIQFAEGTDAPLIGNVILTGTNRHWTYNIWKCPFGTEPTEAPFTVPSGSTLLETGRVWVEGADNAPIDPVYK